MWRVDESHVPVHPPRVDGGHIAFKQLVVVLSVSMTACASSGRVINPKPASDDDVIATVLASHLPPGASACAVAQPRWVEPARRPLMLPLTSADALAWRASPVIDVVAEAEQRDRSGPGAEVRLIRFHGELAALKAELAEHRLFDVTWDRPPSSCTPDNCVVSARQIAPNIVRLDRGLWRERVAGAESQCVAMTREHPHMVEVSFRGAEEMAFSGGLVPLVESTTTIEARAQSVVVTQHDRMDSVEAAEILAAAQVDLLQGRLGTLGVTRRTQDEAVVTSTSELRWDDLSLAIEDRGRDESNRQYAALLLSLEPADGVDPRQLSHALDQLSKRVSLLEHLPIDPSMLKETVGLAERIHAAHPDDRESAYTLAMLYVSHTHEPEKAQPLVDKHALGDVFQQRWIDLGLTMPVLVPSMGEGSNQP